MRIHLWNFCLRCRFMHESERWLMMKSVSCCGSGPRKSENHQHRIGERKGEGEREEVGIWQRAPSGLSWCNIMTALPRWWDGGGELRGRFKREAHACVLSATPRTVACQAPCPWNSSSKNTGVHWHSLLQRIFPTQGSNTGLPHCRWILYHLTLCI